MSKPLQITVGGPGLYDPAPNTTSVDFPLLAGFDFYIEKEGFGAVKYANYQRKNTGGFDLLNGLIFSLGETYSIHLSGGYPLSATSGSYTNGYNLSRVLSALFGRIGWKQPSITGSPVIDSVNLISKSGRKFNDGSFHPLVTISNIKSCMEEAGAADASINSYLTTLQNSIIMRCLNAVFDGREIVEEVKVFERYGQNDQLIANSGLFSYMEIDVAKANDVIAQIDNALLYFDSNVSFNLYLFKDGQVNPLATVAVNAIANTITPVVLDNMMLEPGKYFFGYFQADLGSAKAILELVECWPKSCYFGAIPATSKATGGLLFDRNQRSHGYNTNGLNLEISSFKDHTRQIERKPNVFDELIGLCMSHAIIEQVIYCVRSNSTERIIKEQLDKIGIMLDLNGAAPISESPKVTGLRQRIDRETKKVKELFYPKRKSQIVNLAEC
jgi:hypothetical protein